MACGIPVIASSSGSLGEVIKEAGIIIEPDNPETIAHGIFKLYNSPDLYDELIKKGYERVKCFLPEEIYPKYLDLYKSFM